jgi:hypothetical protein
MNSKVNSFTLKPLYPQRKSERCKNDRRLGRPHSQFGSSGEQKKSCPCSKSIPDHATHKLTRLKEHGGLKVKISVFFASALDEDGLLHAPAELPPGKETRP